MFVGSSSSQNVKAEPQQAGELHNWNGLVYSIHLEALWVFDENGYIQVVLKTLMLVSSFFMDYRIKIW